MQGSAQLAQRLTRGFGSSGRLGSELAYRVELGRTAGIRGVVPELDGTLRTQAAALDDARARPYRQFWDSAAAAVGATVVDLGDDFREIRRAAASTVVQRTLVMLDSPATLALAGDKLLVHRLLGAAGLPVTRHRRIGAADTDAA